MRARWRRVRVAFIRAASEIARGRCALRAHAEAHAAVERVALAARVTEFLARCDAREAEERKAREAREHKAAEARRAFREAREREAAKAWRATTESITESVAEVRDILQAMIDERVARRTPKWEAYVRREEAKRCRRDDDRRQRHAHRLAARAEMEWERMSPRERHLEQAAVAHARMVENV